jgi:hypothetical protein
MVLNDTQLQGAGNRNGRIERTPHHIGGMRH